jgi:catechol 2,3-dioxygenase-like lactoylglutathione lyase family enzyme
MNQKNKIVNISEFTEKIITKANKTRSPDCLLVAISGIDGSGKTTISKQICTQLNRENLNTILVNIDLWHFPSNKGDPRWQSPTDKLFLGIDHTAIAIANTSTSLGFYQDLLGLQLKGESENYGTEQEHLNNVFGARLHISSLKAPTGIGIEFLEYLTPRDGQPFPIDEKANDLIHWQTSMIVEDAETVAQHLETQDYNFVSSGVITIGDRKLGFRQGFLVRDPDGHVLRIIEK